MSINTNHSTDTLTPSTGTLTLAGGVVGDRFVTASGSASLASGTNQTILTLTNTFPRMYMVSVNTGATGGADGTVAVVSIGTNGAGGCDGAVTQVANGTNTDVNVTNTAGTVAVRVNQSTGATQTVTWTLIRLM